MPKAKASYKIRYKHRLQRKRQVEPVLAKAGFLKQERAHLVVWSDYFKMSKQKLKAQQAAKVYLSEHGVEKTISEMINTLVHAKASHPFIFMVSCWLMQIKYLANLVTEQDLKDNGITVSGPLPSKVPLVGYPDFDIDFHSLLREHLTRETWSVMKRKTTSKGGNI